MPLCIYCKVNQVGRLYGVSVPGRRGLRLEGGFRYKWFCSTACSAKDRVALSPGELAAVSRRRTIRLEQRIAARLMTVCAKHLDDRGHVDPTALVRAMIVELRRQYQRNFHQKKRRAKAAAHADVIPTMPSSDPQPARGFVRRTGPSSLEMTTVSRHMCGLHGYNPMLGDSCPACDEARELVAAFRQSEAADASQK